MLELLLVIPFVVLFVLGLPLGLLIGGIQSVIRGRGDESEKEHMDSIRAIYLSGIITLVGILLLVGYMIRR
jgi:hypothetical protein